MFTNQNNQNTQNTQKVFIELIQVLKDLNNQEASNSKQFFNFKETCEWLSLKDSMLRKLVFEKKIPYYKIGKSLRFEKNQLVEWLNKNN